MTLRLLSLMAACLASSAFAAPAHPVYRISGTVHSARDGAAIPHARLSLTSARSDGGSTSDNANDAFSDDQGHFDLSVSGPGRWQITTSARGFYPQGYDEHDTFQSDVVLTPAAPQMELDLRIQPDSSIAGFVLDDAGEAVRGAQVSLFPAPSAAETDLSEQPHGALQVRQTDDRGHYELSNLPPGAYRVSVTAQPWYASAAGRMQRTGSTQTNPAFDVVYPITWYPGATDAEAADTLTLHPGDTQEADFNLLPVPATHLRVNVGRAARGPDADRRSQSGVPQMERISGSGATSTPPMLVFDNAGQAELGGLSPGLYRVRFPGSATGESLFLRVTTGSQRELDVSAALPAVHLSFLFDGLAEEQRAQVTLTDLSTGTRFDYSPPPGGGGGDPEAEAGAGNGRRRFNGRGGGGDGRTLDVPPGRYRLTLSRAGAAYLTGISAAGADVHGNLIDLRQSTVKVTLHVETAPSTVRGICLLHGQPLSGAMVLLVPASLGQTGSIPVARRDETNTDGSFDLRDVSPGQYILVAIDRGWDVNWRDPATLERYLLHGVPLSPTRGVTLKQNVDAQSP